MAQTKDDKKRIAIRDAVIADVVEHGLGNAPMSRIAKRAGVSVGTIYIYFPNKDEMVQSIYLEIKTLLHAAMMQPVSTAINDYDRIRAMWLSLFKFALEHPNFFAFHEIIAAESLLTPLQQGQISDMAQDVRDLLLQAVEHGTVKSLPMDCIVALLFGPAVTLARRMLRMGSSDLELGQLTFDTIWVGLSPQGNADLRS